MVLKHLELQGFLLLGLPFVDDMDEVMSQHKRYPLSSEAELFFKVTQNVAKIDVKKLKNE